MNDDIESLKDSFTLEAIELLDESEEALLDYDNGSEFKACYNKVFRAFHSLKGASGMFGLDELQAHMHKLENLLDKVEEKFPPGSVDYFLAGIDQCRSYFDNDTIVFEYVESFENVEIVKSVATPEIKKEARVVKKKEDKILVFVVDDEKDIVELISDTLEENSYQVEKFYDGLEVVSEVKTNIPDLIISDINMPGLSGIAMVKELSKQGLKIPIVFVSGFVTKQAIMNGLEFGALYFLEKPFREEYLLSLVSTISHKIKVQRVLNKTIDCIMYQFASNEEVLREAGKEKEIVIMKEEIQTLLSLKKEFE